MPDPACATCREKCRRCDRAKPTCGRCAAKGLECKGYPDKFRSRGVTAPYKRHGRKRASTNGDRVSRFEQEVPRAPDYGEVADEGSWEEASPTLDHQPLASWNTEIPREPSLSNSSPSPGQPSDTVELNDLLLLEQTQRLLAYCMFPSDLNRDYLLIICHDIQMIE